MNEKYKVLIVDDDKASLKIYEEVLKKAPEFHVEEAKRGKGAIKKIKENPAQDLFVGIIKTLYPDPVPRGRK